MAPYSGVALLPSPRAHIVFHPVPVAYSCCCHGHHPCCASLYASLSSPSSPAAIKLHSPITSPSHRRVIPKASSPTVSPKHIDDGDSSSSEFEFPVASPQYFFPDPNYLVPLSVPPQHHQAFGTTEASSPPLDPEQLFPLRLPPRLQSLPFGASSPAASPARSPQRSRPSSPLRGLGILGARASSKDFDPFAAALVQIRKETQVEEGEQERAENVRAHPNRRSRSQGRSKVIATAALGREDSTQRNAAGVLTNRNSRSRLSLFFLRSSSCRTPSNPFTSCLGFKGHRSP